MNSKLSTATAVLFVAAIASPTLSQTTYTLSGKVLNTDSTAAAGVKVALASLNLSTTTASDGSWTLTPTATGILGRNPAAISANARQVVVENGRVRLAFDGRDLAGRPIPANARVLQSSVAAARSAVASSPDTLVYSNSNGKVFLRDTLALSNQSGIVRLYDTTWNASIIYGYLTDTRDGQVYRVVTIGTQTVFAQNLDYKADSSWWYDGKADTGRIFGRLYTWATAVGLPDTADTAERFWQETNRQGIAPEGWHIPSRSEWSTLKGYASDFSSLKSAYDWAPDSLKGSDDYGFRAIPAGGRDTSGNFTGIGSSAVWWTSEQINPTFSWSFEEDGSWTGLRKRRAFSVRPFKD